MSFSYAGKPILAQLPAKSESHPGNCAFVMFSCVNTSRRSLSGTPRTWLYEVCERFTPIAARPRPSVWARSAKIGPGDTVVATGTPFSKRKVVPPPADVSGTFDAAPPMKFVTNPSSEPLLATALGMKWLPCT